jgi:hypothetical protein
VIGLILQTPRDDLPFITLSITELQAERQRGIDWVCLIFAAPEIDLKSLLCGDSFPSDYVTPYRDFMFLPVYILKWQLEQARDRLTALMQKVLEEEKKLISKDPEALKDIKGRLFELGKTHLELRNRWLFGRELAGNLTQCFNEITMRHSPNNNSTKTSYSKTLQQRVSTQLTLSEMLKHDFETIPSKIKAQHQMVTYYLPDRFPAE